MRTRTKLGAAIAVSLLAAAVVPGTGTSAATKTTKKKVTKKAAAKTTKKAAPTTEAPTTKPAAVATAAAGPCASKPDTSIDKTNGTNAGWSKWALACAESKPLKAAGDPIVIGLQNPEGDPAGSFPEYRIAAEAATKYINEELGGIGADLAAGKPGRPIKLEVCSMAINPADSTKCANELAGKKAQAVYSTLNFFGNHFATYNAAKIPVIVGTPISPFDFTSPGTYAIGGGGGCLGVHTGLIEFATKDLKGVKVGVPWANTPPGVFCYHDLEKKPLQVLNGQSAAKDNPAALTKPNLTHIGVPILPGQADVTPQAQQVLDFKPDVIVFSAQGADCWTFVSSLGKLGWNPTKIPLVLSGACTDDAKAKEAGDLAKGIYFVGATPITQTDNLKGLLQEESKIYLAKSDKYGAKDQKSKGFATQGFLGMMSIWEQATLAANGKPESLTAQAIEDAFAKTAGAHAFGSTPMRCKSAVAPYVSVCQSDVTATQWNGAGYDLKRPDYSGLYLIKGTALDFGR
jgi:branched-chain amino acid transport system substrate-binding protein